jgi:hypothetical protein
LKNGSPTADKSQVKHMLSALFTKVMSTAGNLLKYFPTSTKKGNSKSRLSPLVRRNSSPDFHSFSSMKTLTNSKQESTSANKDKK